MTGAGGITLPLEHAGASAGVVRADDEAYMRALQAGQLDALATLFERHHRALFNYFLRLDGARARSRAEDLTQDVFVRLLKYRASYRPGASFTAWMYSVARNARLDHLHKHRGEVAWDDAYTPLTLPADGAQAEQEQRLLARALARLSEDRREIIILSRYQELAFDEVAAILGCTPGAARVRLHRALRDLSRQYRQEAGGK